MRKLELVIALLGASALGPALSHAQSADAFAKALHIYGSYRVVPNITYLTANNWEAKLDVYQARDATTPNPTLVYFHGGGWVAGSKEGSSLTFLPFLSMGWNVVNVEYRLAKISLAPAAVQDALCGGSTGTAKSTMWTRTGSLSWATRRGDTLRSPQG
jgi:acetyl esterase/lipase